MTQAACAAEKYGKTACPGKRQGKIRDRTDYFSSSAFHAGEGGRENKISEGQRAPQLSQDRSGCYLYADEEYHMRNGQLKPKYNVQIAINSEYITGFYVFSDRTDVRTLYLILSTLS